MDLASYLGQHLKSDEVIELLEDFDMEVIYDFDRLHEGSPDHYHSSSRGAGFELRFNEKQVLETIWCYVQPRHGYTPVDPAAIGIPAYSSFEIAKSAAGGLGVKTSAPPDGMAWIRLEWENVWHHYEYENGALALVTIMLPWN